MIEYDENNQKFTIRKSLCSDRKHNTDFIESFVRALEANGFSNFQVLLPLNSKSSYKRISFDKFLQIGKVFNSQIIIGDNLCTGDSVKALLVDIKSKSTFDDKDYTDGYCYPSILVKSSDPVRAYYTVRQMQSFTEIEGKKRFFSRKLVNFIFLAVFLCFGVFHLRNNRTVFDLVFQNKSIRVMMNILFYVLSFVFMIFSISDSMKGLWIADFKNNSFKQWLKRLSQGDFNNRLSFQLLYGVMCAFLGAFFSSLFKN